MKAARRAKQTQSFPEAVFLQQMVPIHPPLDTRSVVVLSRLLLSQFQVGQIEEVESHAVQDISVEGWFHKGHQSAQDSQDGHYLDELIPTGMKTGGWVSTVRSKYKPASYLQMYSPPFCSIWRGAGRAPSPCTGIGNF